MTDRRRSKLGFPWLVLIGVALYGCVIGWVGLDEVVRTLREVDIAALAGMAACLLGGFGLRIAKWRYALGAGAPVAPIFFLSKTAGAWSPARIGEFSPLVLQRYRTARVGVWLGADRILEAGMTVGLGALGFAILGLMPWWLLWILGAGGLVGCSAVLVLGRRTEERFGLHMKASDRPTGTEPRSRTTRLVQFAFRVREELLGLGRRLPLLLLYTLIAKGLDLAGVILLYAAFDARVGWALAAAVRGAHGVLSILPDATGVPYIADAALLNRVAGVPAEVWSTAIGVEIAILHLLLLTGLGVSVAWWGTREARAVGCEPVTGTRSGLATAEDVAKHACHEEDRPEE